MSYTRRHSALGGLVSTAEAAAAFVTDPCLPQVANLVLQLHQLEQAQPSPRPAAAAPRPGTPAPPAGPAAPAPAVKGVGLCKVVKPLQSYVWIKATPYRLPVLVGGVVGGLLLLGYVAGKSSRSR